MIELEVGGMTSAAMVSRAAPMGEVEMKLTARMKIHDVNMQWQQLVSQ